MRRLRPYFWELLEHVERRDAVAAGAEEGGNAGVLNQNTAREHASICATVYEKRRLISSLAVAWTAL